MNLNSEYFAEEISWIKDPMLQAFARRYVDLFPPYFAEKPSSSTGKYHAKWSNLPGGLRAHTRGVAYMFYSLAASNKLSDAEIDAGIVAALGHDALKYGFGGGKWTSKTHEYEGAIFFKKAVEKLLPAGVADFPHFEDAYNAIAYHQGRWSTTEPARNLPEEFSRFEKALHDADMVASRAEVNFNFNQVSMIG